MSEAVAHSRRWVVFVPGVLLSVLLAFVLAIGLDFEAFWKLWFELLIGPVKYWFPIMLGQHSQNALHPMTGFSTLLCGVCLPLTLAHPIRPCSSTGLLSGLAFSVWYGWAFLTLLAYLAPC